MRATHPPPERCRCGTPPLTFTAGLSIRGEAVAVHYSKCMKCRARGKFKATASGRLWDLMRSKGERG